MNTIIALVTALVALSMASERVVELLKKLLPFLGKPLKDYPEQLRQFGMMLLAGGIGTLIAWFSRDQLASMLPQSIHLGWPAYAVLGLMSSGGSGFWNHILSIFKAMKVEKVAQADLQALEFKTRADALRAQQQPPTPGIGKGKAA